MLTLSIVTRVKEQLCRVSDPDPVILPALDPDPVLKFLRILEQKKECRKGYKSDLSEEN